MRWIGTARSSRIGTARSRRRRAADVPRRAGRRPGPRRVLQALLVLAGMAALLGGPVLPGIEAPSRAEAHAALVGSVPESGARLDQPPRQVELTFSEPVEVEFSELTLTRKGGGPVELGPLAADGATLRAEVRGPMPAGEYVLHYRVLSQDGHPVEGDVPFTVTAAAPSPGSGTADQQPAPPSPGQDEPRGTTTPEPPATAQPAPERGGAPGWLWVAVGAAAAVIGAALLTLRGRSRR